MTTRDAAPGVAPAGTPAMRILPCGDRALLAELDDLDGVLALHAALGTERPPGIVDVVPAALTVLVVADTALTPLSVVSRWIESAARSEASGVDRVAGRVEVAVRYDGDDLARLAEALGTSPERLAAEHAASTWRVAFTGFAPGFGYLVSTDWPHDVPRLAEPRTRVPAGAVGLAGRFSGVYPRESPGGWQLVGRTGVTLWDAAADPPALLAPGTTVRFVPEHGA